jgi:type VI secretion system Hcp family effector
MSVVTRLRKRICEAFFYSYTADQIKLTDSIFFGGIEMTTYIKIPNIEGNVTAKNYEGWIELESIDFKAKRPISTNIGSCNNRVVGSQFVSEFLLGKSLDKTSPLIFSESCAGKSKPEVEIHICRVLNGELQPWYTYKLYDVMFTGYYTSSFCLDSTHLISGELFSLSFSNLEKHHVPTSTRVETNTHSTTHGFSLLESPILPQWVVDTVAGFGDGISFGLTDWLRTKMGTNVVVNHNSPSYRGSQYAGNIIPVYYSAKLARWTYVAAKYGREIKIGKNWRIAPFGNRTGHKLGEWPHYHRRGKIQQKTGRPRDSQGIQRHRPWEKSEHNDTSFFDRF